MESAMHEWVTPNKKSNQSTPWEDKITDAIADPLENVNEEEVENEIEELLDILNQNEEPKEISKGDIIKELRSIIGELKDNITVDNAHIIVLDLLENLEELIEEIENSNMKEAKKELNNWQPEQGAGDHLINGPNLDKVPGRSGWMKETDPLEDIDNLPDFEIKGLSITNETEEDSSGQLTNTDD